MQVTGQNSQPKVNQSAFNSAQQVGGNACCISAQTNPLQQSAANSAQYNAAGYVPPQNTGYPQNVQVPPCQSGVNIQIFNPSVGVPGGAPTYNVNAPCYPPSYYTNSVGADGKMHPNSIGQTGDNTNNGSIDGNVNTGTNNGTIGNNNTNTTTTNNNTTIEASDSKKKTEKRKIIELTDDYIRNLENYLNSQDKEVRLNAAKEVYKRLEEDESRYDDKALNALINKMLQDPSEQVRFLALSALDGRIVSGDDYTVNLLKNMQSTQTGGFGQDALDASSILLKMSGKPVEKEFEVKQDSKKESKAEKK